MVQQNNGFSFFPGCGAPSFWTDGDFMTRQLAPNDYINFQAVGEYWFSMTIANSTARGMPNTLPIPLRAAGASVLPMAHDQRRLCRRWGDGPQSFFGPGATNASKAVYISQGTLDQPGNPNSVSNSPAYTGYTLFADQLHRRALSCQCVRRPNRGQCPG